MKIKPLHDFLLIERDEPEMVQPDTGIILVVKQPFNDATTGTVVATGPGVERSDGTTDEMVVEVGSKVLFSKGTGIVIDKKWFFIKQRDIMGILR